jgi:hypothetical protein
LASAESSGQPKQRYCCMAEKLVVHRDALDGRAS